MSGLDLSGLRARPAQVWGAVRLVPLVRAEPIVDLRLHRELYEDGPATVAADRNTSYTSYIPHGFVADWTSDGSPAAAYGSQLSDGRGPVDCAPLHFPRRLVQKRGTAPGKGRSPGGPSGGLRFLPLHLALDGYLALHFGGPSIVWEEWTRRAVRDGLSPRAERAYRGERVRGLDDALRVFEIHPGQCGVLVYVADALAAAFVVPHPDDYRALHPSLLQDLYGELMYQYALYGGPVPEFTARIAAEYITSLGELRSAAERRAREWEAQHADLMAGELLDESYDVRRVYRMGRFRLSRFLPPFALHRPQHIGELITDGKGRVAYLKTFRLSDKQVRRGHVLHRLAAHEWHVGRTAEAMGISGRELVRRVDHLGFQGLLKCFG
ncbi:ARPP-2 domain-containing protein [Streptomyces sp. NPDC050355]|uniref:ARG and Rhodanese-Phosphatase-superfamily-associated domain-containing protein n=1 Tax=Streptomyces sirii TaxID=3127701 RepID=A0ABZ2QJR5_9ACTN